MTSDPALLRHDARPTVPEGIPGVVDGLVTASSGPDGSVCVHVVMGNPDAGSAGGGHIELVLRPEHARLLGALLLGERQPAPLPAPHKRSWIPCWLGLRLGRRSA
jgi:hypothetical protein